jgi:hypothetical protein
MCLLFALFLGLPLPCGPTASDPGNVLLLDFQNDGRLDLGDAMALFNYLFSGGPPHPLGIACRDIEDCIGTDDCQ